MDTMIMSMDIRTLTSGFRDDGDGGVTSMDGRLDIRPPYQREFVYDDRRRNLVIDSVLNGLPLNTMYWCDRGDGTLEIMDGQQRTMSICMYVAGLFSVTVDGRDMYFHNLPEDVKARFMAYSKMTVYVCSGTDSEKLAWFRRINVAGMQLTEQELRNAVYAGPWLTDAKKRFSKRGGAGAKSCDGLVKGSPERQELLETALEWASAHEGITVEAYMAEHQHDADAGALWSHWMAVLTWVRTSFPKERKEMASVDWGTLYDACEGRPLPSAETERRVAHLMADDDVTSKKGIYDYIVTGRERSLSIRAFLPGQRREAYEKQGGVCPLCGQTFALSEMEADHITPWSQGGRTVPSNLQMICKACNRTKGAR